VEAETIPQVKEALEAGPDRILLDNMTTEMCRQAVKLRNVAQGKQVQLEASGGIDLGNINQVAKTGVDYISVGAITKNARAIDISMRFI
ncbi:MAG: nicotinate-nucleotide diphosphorylase (carboxylating), partial [Pseudomonadota bacterium]|nr:nicotinate-nucleotide diphosphorylase (carboxylating) [Pseudomonadota bacterium]